MSHDPTKTRLAIPAPAGILLAMTPRPFYRSRLFWLGLPGLVFLLWGWWVSFGLYSAVGFKGPRDWFLGQLAGDILAAWDSDGLPDWGRFEAGQRAVSQDQAGEWKASLPSKRAKDPTSRYLIIPHYAVVLAYVTAWLLTLAWWQRRKSRLLKLHTAP